MVLRKLSKKDATTKVKVKKKTIVEFIKDMLDFVNFIFTLFSS